MRADSLFDCNNVQVTTHLNKTVELRRKKADETITKLRYAEADLYSNLATKLARFADDYSLQVRATRPTLPDELVDRDQGNWEALLQVATVAGGHWVRHSD